MSKRWILSFLAAGFIGIQQASAETALGLSVDGVQTIMLNNKVGKNQIQFVSSAPMEEIHGTASDISGELKLDPANVEGMTGKIVVQVGTMETGIKKRDEHLHSSDWLDAEKYPTIEFEITGLSDVSVEANAAKADIKGTASGSFTMHGVAKELAIPFEATYLLASEKTKKRAAGDLFVVKGEFKIALKDFDIKGARGMVGSRVGTDIDLKANFFGATVVEEAK